MLCLACRSCSKCYSDSPPQKNPRQCNFMLDRSPELAYSVRVMKKTPANLTYAARLKQWRGSRTQRQAACALGVTLRAYQNYEQGRRGVPRDIILDIEQGELNAVLLPESDLRQTSREGKELL